MLNLGEAMLNSFIVGLLSVTQSSNMRIDIVGPLLLRATTATGIR
jgi:hypothetical protein